MPHSNYSPEKRRHPRIKRNLPIKIENGDFDTVAETENISCTGAYCSIDRYLAPLTKVRIRLLVPSKTKEKHITIHCEGAVVRVEKNERGLEESYNVAIYFENIHKTDIAKINRFIKDRSAAGHP